MKMGDDCGGCSGGGVLVMVGGEGMSDKKVK